MTESRIIRFMRFRRSMTVFSVVTILIGMVALIMNGLNLGLDFTGGTSIELRFQQAVQQAEISNRLSAGGLNDAVVQYLGDANSLQIRLPPQTVEAAEVAQRVLSLVSDADNQASVLQIESVGAQVGDELYNQSLLALGLSFVMMMAYVAIRFRFKFAVGAVVSLVHDVLFTVGVFALFGFPFDLTVLAALLALIGYSLNDTIVVFDRIRENFRSVRMADPDEIVDIALTETLRRTIMTVLSTGLVVVALLIFGGTALKWFAVALLVGLFAGTYSSIYIAASIALAMGLNREDFIVEVKTAEEELP